MITIFASVILTFDNQLDQYFNNKVKEVKPYLLSVCMFLLWYRSFYWMRVFEKPAFYILLIQETINDILPFIFLCILALVGFSNLIHVFKISNPLHCEDSRCALYPSEFENWDFADAFLHIYQLSLTIEGFVRDG